MTNDVRVYIDRLHDEIEGKTPGSRQMIDKQKYLGHALLNMLDVLLDPAAELEDLKKAMLDDGEPEMADQLTENIVLYGEYEALRDELNNNIYDWEEN